MKSKDELIDQMVSEMPFVFNEKMRPYIKELMGIWGMLIIYGNAQQSQPSGMRWGIDSPFPLLEIIKRLSGAVEYLLHRKDYDGPDYEELQICIKEAKKFISESSPAGAAEGVKRYETVVNDTGFDKSSEHYVNNVFMRNANVWSDEHDWMMTKDRFVDVVSLFFTTTQPASEGMAEALTVDHVRELYTSETGEGWMVTPVCHGEKGFASWEYQLWLERKLASLSPGVEDNQTKKQ